jgi:N-acetylglucosamine-6-phosphate deacetylase
MEERLGALPATLIKYARDGQLKICMNFDNEHVDLSVSQLIIRLAGVDNVFPMSDRSRINRIGGVMLHQRPDSTLWYQSSGAVAAGTSGMDDQVRGLRRIGVSEEKIWKMIYSIPLNLLKMPKHFESDWYSFIYPDGKRFYVRETDV